MKKICILQNGLARGGTDTFVRNLSVGLVKRGYKVTIVNTASDPKFQIGEEELKKQGVNIFHTNPLTGAKNKIKHLYHLYEFLKRENFDVFQTNIDLFNGPNLLIANLAGVSVRCCHSHNGMQQKELRQGATLPVRIYQKIMRSLIWYNSNRRCGCSELAMEFLFKGYDWRKGSYPKVISNGIDIDRFNIDINVHEKLKELGLKSGKYILTVGHLIPQKNSLFIAQIFSDFCKSNKDCDLIWVGKGELKAQVEGVLKNGNCIDRVHFFDNRNDIDEIMNCSDLFILPSSFEGLPVVSIESQASGMPTLLSDRITTESNCGLAKFLPINKGTGIWIKEIEKILDGNCDMKIDNEKLSKFSTDYMVTQMEEVFKS